MSEHRMKMLLPECGGKRLECPPTRKKNKHHLPDLKFENFGLNSEIQEGKSGSIWTPSSQLGSKKSSPELEVNPKHWTIVSEGFPPGVTVDELKNYGRRRQLTHLRPQDNLRLEEGSLKALKSEYKRRYQAYAPLILIDKYSSKKEDSEEDDYIPEYRKSYINYPRSVPVLRKPLHNLLPLKDHPMEISTEKNSEFVPYLKYERRKLLRRSTALKPEGEMTSETEVRREFKGYPSPEKVLPIRRLPSLKLEGEFETMTTEQKDKFIAFLLGQRPILEKKKTLLKMEGNFDFLTEKNLSYVPHTLTERPKVRKRSTSLKLDGEVEFFPEYRYSYVDFPRTRPITYKPNENIRHEGNFEKETETKTKFINYENILAPESTKPENHLHVEGEMEISPEYKMNYVDFPRERPFLRKPLNQLKPEGNLQVVTENSERFSDVPATKSESLRRPNNLKLEGHIEFLSENSEKFKKYDVSDKPEIPKINSNLKLEGEIDFVTEKADKFGFLVTEKELTGRRPSSLKLEGEFLFLPEYRRSYIDYGKIRHFLKPLKSNPISPRKKLNKKLHFEEDKKPELGTPSRSNSKRLKEASPVKSLKFEIPNNCMVEVGNSLEQNLNKEFEFQSQQPSLEDPQMRPKEFPAFQVLDVKGQVGCQSMAKNILENERSSSSEDSSTYRLEVTNAGVRSPGFHKNDRRVFPNPAIKSEELEAAELRARQRAENFVKVVKSPEIPNYLLENNGNENRWKISEKLEPLIPADDLKKRAFVVLDNTEDDCPTSIQTIKEDVKERKDWNSNWMSS